jgi:hypothetical protein
LKILATVAVLLLALVGYSLGSVLRFGKKPSRKPAAWDIVLVLLMWVGVIASRIIFPANKWLMLAVWIAAGAFLGFLMSLILGYSRGAAQAAALAHTVGPADAPRKRFRAWRDLSAKLGTFQGQIFLGLLFLVLFAPVALAVKLFSDPLHIKKAGTGTHWFPKEIVASDIELFKMQS